MKGYFVYDVYMGANIPAGKKSLAMAIILQDDARTLVDSEINSVISAIITKLEAEFDVQLRD